MSLVAKIDMDNGSFPLAKDALRSLAKTKISGAHRAIIDVIWMETYGWHDPQSSHKDKLKRRKTVAQISYDVFINETWMDKSTISRKLNELVKWGIVIRNKNTNPFSYSFNVQVADWSPEVFRNTKVAQTVNSLQDGKQLTGLQDDQQFNEQSTKSLTNSQQKVDRTVNSCQPQSQERRGLEPSLNNINNINNILSLTGEGHSPPAASQGQENTPPNNQQLIAELVRKYRETGVKAQKGDYPFIGRLYNEFGYDRVLMGINALGYKLAAGFHPDDPLIYLGGIVRKGDKINAKSRGDPCPTGERIDQYAQYNSVFKTKRNSRGP